MGEFSKEPIQDTIKVWSPKYGYEISETEAIEIITNLTGFFDLLNDWAKDTAKDTSREMIEEVDFRKIGKD